MEKHACDATTLAYLRHCCSDDDLPPLVDSDRMLTLCLDLRGFYLKSGQFLGTRHDFMPKVFLRKLG